MNRSYFAVLTLLVATSLLAPRVADACSFPAPGWQVQSVSELAGPSEGPFIILLQGIADFGTGEVPPLDDSTFDVEVVDGEGAVVEGTFEYLMADEGMAARMAWTPAEPLGEGEYTLSMTGEESGGVEAAIRVREVGDPTPSIDAVNARELERDGGTMECCTAAQDGESDELDGACVRDSCGDFRWGKECRICWSTDHLYPILLKLEYGLEGGATNHYDLRLYRTNEEGGDRTLLQDFGAFHDRGGFPTVPEETEFPVCLQLEAESAVDGSTHSGDVVCATEDEVERVERTDVDNAEVIARCDVESFVEVDENGEETPIDEPGGTDETDDTDDDSPTDGTDGDSSGKTSPGCGGCSSTDAGPGWFSLLILALFAARRRR